MTVLQWLPWCAVLTAFTCTLTQWAVNCWYRYLLLESIEKWLLFVFENPGKVLEILVTYCGHFAWELLYWVMQCSLCDGLSDVCIEVATQHRMIILVSVNVATQLKAIKWIESEISFNKSYVTYILRHSCFCYVDFILLTYFLHSFADWFTYLLCVCAADPSLPRHAAAERSRGADRQNTVSWLVDTRNSPVSPYGFHSRLIGRRSASSGSRDLWDMHDEWWTFYLCSWPTLWSDEDWYWLQQHRHGVSCTHFSLHT